MNEIVLIGERNRLYARLKEAGVSEKRQDALAPLIQNLAWQKVKLDEAREELNEASLTCHYDNGGGQSGERENPLFKAYINLWRAFMTGFDKYLTYLPKEAQEELQADAENVLAQVMQMRNNA